MARPTIREQIQEAYEKTWKPDGFTYGQLGQLAGLDLSSDSIRRKVIGDQPLTVEEADALARALRISIVGGSVRSSVVATDATATVNAGPSDDQTPS